MSKFLSISESFHRQVFNSLSDSARSQLGQYMTSSAIARFMSALFDYSGDSRLLDAGAGTGALTASFLDEALQHGINVDVDVWEVDPVLQQHLQVTLDNYVQRGNGRISAHLHPFDFIEDASFAVQMGIAKQYTHIILNPPYKKIKTLSHHRQLLRKVGIETVNLYTGFVALAILLLKVGGELVTIIPRSFCNGSYYRPFREFLLKHCAIRQIHLFDSRNSAFSDDSVLQENIIIHLCKQERQSKVIISCSQDASFANYAEKAFDFDTIVKVNDKELFIHIPTQQSAKEMPTICKYSLTDIGIDVCTGPVVDFRLKDCWSELINDNTVPLLYPHHFSSGELVWPKHHKAKPNSLLLTSESKKWLMPNGHYVLVKRFSSKEERRRIVAYHLTPEMLSTNWIGFENHWNILHVKKQGLNAILAKGITIFLNSTILDQWFRVFSGHTQVNATDLRALHYPSNSKLQELGERAASHKILDQITIDQLVSILFNQ